MKTLLSVPQAAELIRLGAKVALAGSHAALAALPKGDWIGGTSYFFMGPEGGTRGDDVVFATVLSSYGDVEFARIEADRVADISVQSPENGFSFVIIPFGSETLVQFAMRPYCPGLFMRPVVGWVSGTDVTGDAAALPPAVFDGRDLSRHENCAVVARVRLPETKMAVISIIDPFEPRPDVVIRFPKTGFSATECELNGQRRSLLEVLRELAYDDGALPLIGNFMGAQVNVSIKAVSPGSSSVEFFAPVFEGIDYRLAKPVNGFAEKFAERLSARESDDVVFSCNCILNYIHGNMEGKRTANAMGPVTFGEIGYQLLNQTLVMMEVL